MKLQPLNSESPNTVLPSRNPVNGASKSEFELAMARKPENLLAEQRLKAEPHAARILPNTENRPKVHNNPGSEKAKNEHSQQLLKPTPQAQQSEDTKQLSSSQRKDGPSTLLESSKINLNVPTNTPKDINTASDSPSTGKGASGLAIHLADLESIKPLKHNESRHPTSPIEDPTVLLVPFSQTPGDRLLSGLQSITPSAPLARDLTQLLDALRVHLQTGSTPNKSATVLHITLPNLGAVEVQLSQASGQLLIDILASPGNLLQLQQARIDLMERLHKINPEYNITLSFSDARQEGEHGSRQRRHVHDEGEVNE